MPPRPYFPLELQLRPQAWDLLGPELIGLAGGPLLFHLRLISHRWRQADPERAPSAGHLLLLSLLNRIFRHVIGRYFEDRRVVVDVGSLQFPDGRAPLPELPGLLESMVDCLPPWAVREGQTSEVFLSGAEGTEGRRKTLVELFLLATQTANPAAAGFTPLFDDAALRQRIPYRSVLAEIDRHLRSRSGKGLFRRALLDILQDPLRAHPDSLTGQLRFVRDHWQEFIPDDLLNEIQFGIDVLAEEAVWRGFGPGPLAGPGLSEGEREPEAFSPDVDWMPRVVMIAKTIFVWLDQLSRRYNRPIHRLDQIPDEELDALARYGFTALWLIGIWERSPASEKIKRRMGNPEAVSSAYSLYDYVVAGELGGPEALDQLRTRCVQRGIRLACDVVPNHTGLYSRWVREHPDWFIQSAHPPFPAYCFSGPDLSFDSDQGIFIEDGYWDHSDAAVVFKHEDSRSGRVRYIYHGNDGTHMPWNDTAQLNYLLPEVRETVIRTVIGVARRFSIIRFDAAMTLAKKHFQRLWYPLPGGGAGVPSRAEHQMSQEDFERAFPKEFWRELVDRVAVEAPDTLLLAEAFWLMEGYFVRTLGMHRVYNSAFMNMLKQEENAKYRRVIQEILEFNPEILKRFVNFMNNPDEATAVEQFGKSDKYFGIAVLLATMPGLPMFGHGQIEGLREKYGMEYRRAYWDETVDEGFLHHHEDQIFPLLRRRYLFSEVAHFQLFDFVTGHGVDENVFALTNRCGMERALVLFHNRAGETEGVVRQTMPKLPAGAGEGASPVQAGLGEALALSDDRDSFCRFREYRTGLEFLRTGPEIHAEGLTLRLGPYDYRVFLDFREFRDEDGSWTLLHGQLQGQPVPDLDRALARIRFASLGNACRELVRPERLKALVDLSKSQESAPAGDEKSLQPVAAHLENFLAHLGRAVGAVEGAAPLRKKILEDLKRFGLLLDAGEEMLHKEIPLKPSRDERPDALPFLILVLLFRRLGELDGGWNPEGRTADWLEDLILADVLREFYPAEDVLLLTVLIRHQRFRITGPGRESWTDLFAAPDVAGWLGMHTAQGCRWLNRERLESLTWGLAWIGALTGEGAEKINAGREGGPKGSVWAERREILDLAEAVEYRVDDFLAAHLAEQTNRRKARLQSRLASPVRKILFVASEAAPYAKTGGLADVAGALPRALQRRGHDVRLVLPYYRQLIDPGLNLKPGPEQEFWAGGTYHPFRLLEGSMDRVPVLFVDAPAWFDRPGLYGEGGGDYGDNGERFGLFCRAVLEGARSAGFCPDVIHCHDWQAALVPLLLRTDYRNDPWFADAGSLLTIHNLGYQGVFSPDLLAKLNLPPSLFAVHQIEYFGEISLLKGGVRHADLLNTVSPTYCREIQTPDMGYGFDGLLRTRQKNLFGVLNGIDMEQWDPARDPALVEPFTVGETEKKAVNKRALQEELGLCRDPDAPLAVMVTRIDRQKGLDLVADVWQDLLDRGVQIVLLGTGDQEPMDRFAVLARKSPDRTSVNLVFDDRLSRRIYAAADLFLMPSRYEPCGLGQLIALRYGAVPVVRRTGGLADTVIDPLQDAARANGFWFLEAEGWALLGAVDRALERFRDRNEWAAMVRRGMAQDLSWDESAGRYLELYRLAMEKRYGEEP